jgi:stage V sporulation protein D (sporulation-specific penicillin-binding protein)
LKEEFEDFRRGADLDEDSMGREAYYKALNERANVQGVWFEERYLRSYPYNSLASKVVGFSNAVDVGTTGVENYYDGILNGTDGRQFGYLNENSEFERTTIAPEHGKTLRLTLDMNIQEIVQQKIDDFDRMYGDEAHNGKGAKNVGVIVMNPNTGEILAMATNREYDLNDPSDLTTEGYSGAQIKAMDDNTYVEELNTKWQNFCVSEGYEPGSVFKPITVASALETGSVHDGDGFHLTGADGALDYRQSATASHTLYSDYYWYEIGDVIGIGDNEFSYFCFPPAHVSVSKARLATEELYKLRRAEKRRLVAERMASAT